MTGVLQEERDLDAETQNRHREDYVMVEVAIGVMQLQAKECKGLLVPPEARKQVRNIPPQNLHTASKQYFQTVVVQRGLPIKQVTTFSWFEMSGAHVRLEPLHLLFFLSVFQAHLCASSEKPYPRFPLP